MHSFNVPAHRFSKQDFAQHSSIIEIAFHQLFLQMGKSIISLSLPFYLIKTLGYSLPEVMIFYFFWQIPHTLFSPSASKIIQSLGLKHSIALRSWSNAFFWLLLPFLLQGNFWQDIIMLLPLFCIRAVGNVTSEVSYHVFLVHHSSEQKSGGTVAMIRIMSLLASVTAPVIGGFITFWFGLPAAAIASTMCFILSGIVMLFGKDEYIDESHITSDTHFLVKVPSPLLLAQVGITVPDTMLWILWPSFLAFILPNIASLGLLSSISTAIAMLVAFYIGSRLDGNKSITSANQVQYSSIRCVVLSIMRFVWLEPIGLAIADSLSKINNETLYIPYDRYLLEWLRTNTLIRAQSYWQTKELTYSVTIGLCVLCTAVIEYHTTAFYALLFISASLTSIFTTKMGNIFTQERYTRQLI